MSVQIKGTVALVTGANRGIGRALVEALLARGAAKIYAGARKPETLAELVEKSGGRVVPVAAAIADDVRLVINNAGIVAKFGGELTDANWVTAGRDEFETNVLGVLSVTQAFVPALTSKPGGAVANVGSVAGFVNFPSIVSYSASKAAVHSITQAIRALLRPRGIYVAGVYPGPIDTEMAREIDLPKTSPDVAANAILDGLEAGREEIFPDPFAEQIGGLFLKDPKGLERQFGVAEHEEAVA